MLVVLFWRENERAPAGILPRAFSDMPRSWTGSASSTFTVDEFCDWFSLTVDGAGVGCGSSSLLARSLSFLSCLARRGLPRFVSAVATLSGATDDSCDGAVESDGVAGSGVLEALGVGSR